MNERSASFVSKYGRWAVVAGASEGLGAAFAGAIDEAVNGRGAVAAFGAHDEGCFSGECREADVSVKTLSDVFRERRLAETGWPVQQDVVRRLAPRARCGEQDREVGLDLALAYILVEVAGPQRALDDDIRVVPPCRPPGSLVGEQPLEACALRCGEEIRRRLFGRTQAAQSLQSVVGAFVYQRRRRRQPR